MRGFHSSVKLLNASEKKNKNKNVHWALADAVSRFCPSTTSPGVRFHVDLGAFIRTTSSSMTRIPEPPREGSPVSSYAVRVLQLAVLAHCQPELSSVYDQGRSRCGGGRGELMIVFPTAEEMTRTLVRDVCLMMHFSTDVKSNPTHPLSSSLTRASRASCATLFCGTHSAPRGMTSGFREKNGFGVNRDPHLLMRRFLNFTRRRRLWSGT